MNCMSLVYLVKSFDESYFVFLQSTCGLLRVVFFQLQTVELALIG